MVGHMKSSTFPVTKLAADPSGLQSFARMIMLSVAAALFVAYLTGIAAP
jgi:hypothetical protein